MFDDSEWLDLVNELMAATQSNGLKWTEQGDRVLTHVGESVYEIGSVDGDGRLPYYLSVSLLDGHSTSEVGRLESEPYQEDRPWTAGERLLDLRKLAFRSAKGAPQIFSKLLSELKATVESPSERSTD